MEEEDDIFNGLGIAVSLEEREDLDGLESNISDEDLGRRNTIVNLLEDWGLLKIIDVEDSKEPTVSLAKMKIIPHREKNNWELVPKYHIGRKK